MRSPVFPDLPTVAEVLPGYESSVWFGVAAPKQTPAEIVLVLNQEINAGLNDPVFRKRLSDVGGEPMTGSPAEFEKRFVADAQKWTRVIAAAGVKGE